MVVFVHANLQRFGVKLAQRYLQIAEVRLKVLLRLNDVYEDGRGHDCLQTFTDFHTGLLDC
jgi:hypothetical protein